MKDYWQKNWEIDVGSDLVEHHSSVPHGLAEDTLEMSSLAGAMARFARGNTSRPFVMVELGAGTGRWSLHAIKLGEFLGVPVRAIAVEAEPTHFRMMLDAFRVAGVDPAHHRLLFAATGARDGSSHFFTGAATEWFGQRLCDSWDSLPHPSNWGGTERAAIQPTEVMSLETILDGEGEVDLVDLDIQGSETEVLAAALEQSGDGWLSTTSLRGVTYLRAGIVNYLTTEADIDRLLATLRRLATA